MVVPGQLVGVEPNVLVLVLLPNIVPEVLLLLPNIVLLLLLLPPNIVLLLLLLLLNIVLLLMPNGGCDRGVEVVVAASGFMTNLLGG